MTVPDFASAFDTSLPGPAFSNGHEGECWAVSWCQSCEHRPDDADGCALLDVAAAGRIPSQWTELEPGSLRNRWLCHRWSPIAGYIKLIDELGIDP